MGESGLGREGDALLHARADVRPAVGVRTDGDVPSAELLKAGDDVELRHGAADGLAQA